MAGVGSVVAGALTSRVGSAPVLRVAGPLVPLAVVAVGAATSLPLLVAALVLVGLGLGSVDATMTMQGVLYQQAAGRPAVNGFYAVWSLAGILGALAASLAADTSWSLLAFFAAVAAVLVPADLVAGRGFFRHDHPEQVVDALDGRTGVPWRPILVLGAAVTALFVADSTTSNWSAVYLTDALGSSESVAALAYAGYATAMLVGRALGDVLVARWGPVALVRTGGAVATAAVLLVVAAPGPGLGVLGFTLLGLGLCVVLPQAFVAAAAWDPVGTGVAVARVNVFNYVGFLVGAPLVGVVSELASLRAAVAVLVPVTLLIVALAGSFAGPVRAAP